MKRAGSTSDAVKDITLGPSQREQVNGQSSGKKDLLRSKQELLLLLLVIFLVVAAGVLLLSDTLLTDIPGIFKEVASFQRLPKTAQDNVAAAVAFVIVMIPMACLDYLVCGSLCKDVGARWFLLHGLGNLIVAFIALPDFYYVWKSPMQALSVEYCAHLPFPACSDWPTVIIVRLNPPQTRAREDSKHDSYLHR